jgi:hypothetical protein
MAQGCSRADGPAQTHGYGYGYENGSDDKLNLSLHYGKKVVPCQMLTLTTLATEMKVTYQVEA